MQDTPYEPWIADIALELTKIRETMEEILLAMENLWDKFLERL